MLIVTLELQPGPILLHIHPTNVNNPHPHLSPADNILTSNHSLNSILLSHFILDLRSIYLIEKKPTNTSQQATSLQFAANFQGTMGASLDTAWVTGQERHFEEDEETRYSDDPLATGLLDDEKETSGEMDQGDGSKERCVIVILGLWQTSS